MQRSRVEYQGGPSRLSVEDPFPPLNLLLRITPEFINSIESILCPQLKLPYSTENTNTPPETPKNTEKPKALNIPLSKITIGEWSHTRVYPDDLKAKFYFAKKKLMWEILDNVGTGTQVSRLKRKMELKWFDVLSFKATFDPHDETLEIELGKRPTFFIETNPQAGKHTQWQVMDQDFTGGHSASIYRRHRVHFLPGDLQKTLEKLMSADSFWSKLAEVSFPTLPQSLYFDIGYGNRNYDDSSTLSSYGNYQEPSFSVSNDPSYDHYHYPRVEECNMATQFWPNDGRQMRNTGEFGGSEAYAQETQTNSTMFQHMNDDTVPEIGTHLLDIFTEEEIQNFHAFSTEGEKQNIGAYFQTDNRCVCDQCRLTC